MSAKEYNEYMRKKGGLCMVPRLGHIAFLNVLPLTYALAHGAAEGLESCVPRRRS